jgi:hypothetical protein
MDDEMDEWMEGWMQGSTERWMGGWGMDGWASVGLGGDAAGSYHISCPDRRLARAVGSTRWAV